MATVGNRYRSSIGKLTKASYSYRGYPVDCTSQGRIWTAWFPVTTALPFVGENRYCYDSKTPDYWKKRVKGQWLPTNDLSLSINKLELIGSSHFTQTSNGTVCSNPAEKQVTEWMGQYVGYNWGPTLVALTPLDRTLLSNMVRESETRCSAERQAGKANYVESLGELDRTYSMLTNPLENVNRFLSRFQDAESYRNLERMRKGGNPSKRSKRSRNKVPGSLLELAAAEWLRFRYGISPLISDVKAGMKALRETYDIEPKRHSARGSGQLFAQGQTVGTPVVTANWTLHSLTTGTDTYSVRSVWTDEYRATPFDVLGLTFRNVVGAGWEFTKLSFVVDWFVNVGDLIYANVPRVGVNPLGGATTERLENVTIYQLNKVTHPVGSAYTLSGPPSDYIKATTINLDRRVMKHGSSALVIKSDFRLDNWIRASDAVTLLIQQLGRLRF